MESSRVRRLKGKSEVIVRCRKSPVSSSKYLSHPEARSSQENQRKGSRTQLKRRGVKSVRKSSRFILQQKYGIDVVHGRDETCMNLQEGHHRFHRQGDHLEEAGMDSLTTFTGDRVKLCGNFTASVSSDEFYRILEALEVIIVNSGSRFTQLLGRSWLDIVNPKRRKIPSS